MIRELSSEDSEGKLAANLYNNQHRDRKSQHQIIKENENLLNKMIDKKKMDTVFKFQDTIKTA